MQKSKSYQISRLYIIEYKPKSATNSKLTSNTHKSCKNTNMYIAEGTLFCYKMKPNLNITMSTSNTIRKCTRQVLHRRPYYTI